jgi:hypothetical protein
MLEDMEIPWLALKDDESDYPSWSGCVDVTDDDAEGSPDDDVAVTEALDSMVIEDSSTSVQLRVNTRDSIFPKRKRTLSLVTPPKVSLSRTIVHMYIDVS